MAPSPGRLAFFFIFTTVLLNMIGFGVVMPVMPQLIMEVSGEDLAHAAKWGGILSFSYAVMQFAMMPVMGALSDRFGRRPVILASLAAYSTDFLLMALAPTIGWLLAARILAGAFSATFTTANAYIADISPPEKRAANFGMMGAAFGLGFIIGPGLGGLLGEHFGPRAPFYFVAMIGAANLVYGLMFLPETLAAENRRAFSLGRANALGNFRRFREYPAILPIALVIFFGQLAHWTFPSVWSYFAEERYGWTPSDIGLSLMAVGVGSAIVQGGLTRLVVPRVGEHAAAIFGMSIATAVYLGYAFADKGWMVYALIPFGALAGFTLPSLQSIMSRTLPANAQGELQGAIGAINGLTMIIGPFLMTQVFSAFAKPGTPFAIGDVVVLPSGAPFYFPGAPFAVASALVLCGLLTLRAAFARERPRATGDISAQAPRRD
jgi:DHA1 family tetracycline resistance protein-like MFS transporter